ncbi:hypothetical protein PMIN06_011321 [Paraphaeosphaeria minitans]
MSTPLARCDLYADVENRALICRKCKYALATSGSQVTTHLDKKHYVSKELRKGLTRYLRQHPCGFKDPNAIPIRPNGSPPHPELRVHEGFACRECDFYTTSSKLLTGHLSTLHLRERASRQRTDPLYDDVFLQTWSDGPTRKYWTVSVNGNVSRQVTLPGAEEHLKSVREREHTRRKEQQRIAMADTGSQAMQNTGPWMERTRWPITFQGVRRDMLLSLAEIPTNHDAVDFAIGPTDGTIGVISPSRDEKKIWHLTQAVQLVLDRCEETMRHTGRPLLCWLVTTPPSPCFPKPFKFVAREKTRRSYRRWLKGFLAFIFRAWRMEPNIRSSLAGIRLSQKQSARLQSIWEHPLWGLRTSPGLWADLRVDHRSSNNARGDATSAAHSMSEGDSDEGIDGEVAHGDNGNDMGDGEDNSDPGLDLDAEEITDSDADLDGRTDSSSDVPTMGKMSEEILDAAAELLQLLFELCITFMTEEFRDGQASSSTLVYYSGVLALRGTGETFRSAKLFTPILSSLIYIQRLLFPEYALPYKAYSRIGLERRPRYGQLERSNAVRLK